MPDRDPAPEAALRVWYDDTGGLCCNADAFEAGYHAALRSLGAGTPEAVAALRELVEAAQRYAETSRAFRIDNPQSRFDHDHSEQWLKDAAIAFAALATPTEEGR